MSGFGIYASKAFLDFFFRGTTFSLPTDLHVALFTNAPTNMQTGAGGTVSTAYPSRLAVTRNTTNFSAAAGSAIASTTNSTDMEFGNAAANDTIRAVGFYDASTGGNWLGGFTLASPLSVTSGQPTKILASSFTCTLD